MSKVLLEICCGSAEDALNSAEGGADRVELCSALFLGGLTPSLGSLERLKQTLRIPIVAMVRPRGAGFCYSDVEIQVMEQDARLLLEHGADGIVFGILDAKRNIDTDRCRRLLDLAAGRQTVFHRAFDVVADPFRALEELIELGFTRVLTSGQQPSAPEGADLIAKLVERAAGRIEVLPGAGIRPRNVADLLKRTGCTQVHTTAFGQQDDPSTAGSVIQFGSPANPSESSYDLVDSSLVRTMREALDAIQRS